MLPLELPSATLVVRDASFMEAEVDDEIIALSIEKGTCYGLNSVGARIWRMLAEPAGGDEPRLAPGTAPSPQKEPAR